MDSSQRMSFYRKQFRLGNLQVLCGRCNAWKGDLSFAAWRSALNAVSEGSRSDTIIKAGEQVQQPRLGRSPREDGAATETLTSALGNDPEGICCE